jgi:hypothetical protein
MAATFLPINCRTRVYLVADATYSTGTEFIADGGATVGQTLDT